MRDQDTFARIADVNVGLDQIAEGLSGYGNSQLFEEFGSAERDGVLIDMPEDSDAWRFLYSVELPGQPAIGRIVRKAS
jgi:hypothetical protein